MLPEDICLAVKWHHNYAALGDGSAGIPRESRLYIALALVADLVFARQQIGTTSADWRPGAEFALAALNITQLELDEIVKQVSKEYARL